MLDERRDAGIIEYAASYPKKSIYWSICLLLATLHLSALLPLGVWFTYVAFNTAFSEMDWTAMTWRERFTFAPWEMFLPQLISVIAGVLTWGCIWERWRGRAAGRWMAAAATAQGCVALFILAAGPCLVQLGWVPLRHSGQARVLTEAVYSALLMHFLISLPMLAFIFHREPAL